MSWLRALPLSVVALLSAGCARGGGETAAVVADTAGRHAEVDRWLAAGDRQGARRALQDVIEGVPMAHPLARPLIQDARFRLAQLALAEGDPLGAVDEADAGLALGTANDVPSANLLVVRGTAREALGQGADAAADYERALAINEALLREVVPAP